MLEHTSFEPLLDSVQAAALLDIHAKTLQKMARNGEVPGRKIGDLWRFRASELDGWLRSIGGQQTEQGTQASVPV